MTAMLDIAPPDGTELLIEWLSPLGEVRDERPNNSAMPFRMVNDLGGPADGLSSRCMYSIHTFDIDKVDAQAAAMETHRRIMLLVGQYNGQQSVTLSNGQTVYVDDIDVMQMPHWEQWVKDNSIHRYVGSYQITLRAIPAT